MNNAILALKQMQDEYEAQRADSIAPPIASVAPAPAILSPSTPEAPEQPKALIAPPPAPVGEVGGAMPAIQLPQVKNDQAELDRLKNTGSGISQIKNKPLRVLARIGDIAGSAMFPSIMQNIPGTTLHHDDLMEQQEHNIAQDLDTAKKTAALNPAAQEPKDEFALWHQQNPKGTVQEFERAKGGDKLDMAIRKLGFKRDEQGNIVADPDSAVTKQASIKNELAEAQIASTKAGTALKEAQEELARTRNDPNSPAYQLALRKLDVAKMNSESMALRGRAAWANYLMHSQSVDEQGNTLPGAMMDDNGNAIGSTFSQNVRPTGQQRGKANLAQSADEQLKDMKSIVQKRQDIFGPAAGRTTDFTVWAGSQDPDAQRFRAARTIAGDHLAGVFGGRSEAALDAIDAAIGHFKDNPKAIMAGLDQLSKANSAFVKAGVVHTKGSSEEVKPKASGDAPASTGPKAGDVVDGFRFKGGDAANQSNWQPVGKRK